MKKLLFVLSASLVFILGCKKDDDDDEPTDTVTINNVSGDYKLTEFAYKFGPVTVSYYDSIPACSKDDVISLKSDKTYTWPDTGVKCSSGSSDDSGTWDLSGTTKFIWDGEEFNIDRFDGKSLELSISGTDTTGQQVSQLLEFQKQ